ncbi:MAG: polyprenyl synthetase family protein [Bacteroidetes bacterium]|nr:polyprenyl synthetase family protein [Bacteroidota bacterium]
MGSADKKFELFFDKERKIIEKKIAQSLKYRKPASLYGPASYIMEEGGKRLRPLLVLMSVKAVDGNLKNAYNAAAAVEFLHNFTLVHDDIMDNADKRRGKITLHKKYDISTAILAGDSLLSVAYEFLLKDCDSNNKNILEAFTKGLVDVCEGQSLDKEFEISKEVSLEEYILMIQLKTAAMIEMCCKIGAMLGGGSEEEIKALAGFGKNIGIAFQIQDDLLDITGNENELGKFIGGDLVEGKKTFLFIKALERASGNDRKKLLNVINKKGILADEVESYKILYVKLNVLEEAKQEIKKFTNRALNSIKDLKIEHREHFNWLADLLINRNK